MSIHDYLHEKAAESRHNETIAYIMFLAGSVFFVGGILSSLVMSRETSWFLFIPYIADFTEAMFLEMSFLLVGVFLSVAGIGAGLHYYRARNWYLKELTKAKDTENIMSQHSMQISPPISTSKTRTTSKRAKTSK
jgi:cytochrome b subunit of formate dehydrogenase